MGLVPLFISYRKLYVFEVFTFLDNEEPVQVPAKVLHNLVNEGRLILLAASIDSSVHCGDTWASGYKGI